MVPAPQQSSSAVHVAPLVLLHARQFAAGGAAVLAGASHDMVSKLHTLSAPQQNPPLGALQHSEPAGQQAERPSPDPLDLQHVLPASQQYAKLLAPGPDMPQHDCVELHCVDDRKCRQHCLSDPAAMHDGVIVPSPQHVSPAAHVGPMTPAAALQAVPFCAEASPHTTAATATRMTARIVCVCVC